MSAGPKMNYEAICTRRVVPCLATLALTTQPHHTRHVSHQQQSGCRDAFFHIRAELPPTDLQLMHHQYSCVWNYVTSTKDSVQPLCWPRHSSILYDLYP